MIVKIVVFSVLGIQAVAAPSSLDVGPSDDVLGNNTPNTRSSSSTSSLTSSSRSSSNSRRILGCKWDNVKQKCASHNAPNSGSPTAANAHNGSHFHATGHSNQHSNQGHGSSSGLHGAGASQAKAASSVLDFAHNRFDYRKARPSAAEEHAASLKRDAAVLHAVCGGLAESITSAALCVTPGGKPSPILVAKLVEQCVLLANDGSGSAAALRARLDEQLQRSLEYKKAASPRDCDSLGSHKGFSNSPGSATGANSVVVVTAFETTHAAVAQRAALPALRCAGVDAVVYDLGLAPPVRLALAAEFGSPSFTWQPFPFDEYPPHFRLGRAYTRDGAGEYAWKVAAIARVAAARRGAKVLWTDAGNWLDPSLLAQPSRGLWFGIGAKGVLAKKSSGTISRWTYGTETISASSAAAFKDWRAHLKVAGSPGKGIWEYFNATSKRAMWGPLEANCHGALVGFDTSQPAASALLDAWLDCALHPQCIAPAGSHRGNHRQDQAALSLLVLLSREGQVQGGGKGHNGGGGFACSELSKLPVGPHGAVGVANDKLITRAAEYVANWPDLSRKYAMCKALPSRNH